MADPVKLRAKCVKRKVVMSPFARLKCHLPKKRWHEKRGHIPDEQKRDFEDGHHQESVN
jgi:hypothetical protein